MKHWHLPALAAVLTLFLVGCSADPRDEKLTEALNQFNLAADQVAIVRKTLATAVDKAREKNSRLLENDLKEVEEQAKKLRDIGKELLKLKGRIELDQERTSPADQERFRQEFGPQTQQLFQRLDKEQQELDRTVAQAKDWTTPGAYEKLTRTLHDAYEEFRILTKPH